MIALIFVLKILASIVSLGSGFRGGLFFASLLLGALGGQLFATAFSAVVPGVHIDPDAYAIIGLSALSTVKSAVTIAIRYGNRRRQFGEPGEPETPLLDYRTHQRRLIPALATTYALSFAQQELTRDTHTAFTQPDYPEDERRQLEAQLRRHVRHTGHPAERARGIALERPVVASHEDFQAITGQL